MKNDKPIILGAGITGLSAGINTQGEIYEADTMSGGICASYYVDKTGNKTYSRVNEESYRFEVGGGHWIFKSEGETHKFISKYCGLKKYQRESAVYFPDMNIYVPYPLQNNLYFLPQGVREKALSEILNSENNTESIITLADWLKANFGKTLCKLFFFPFHELYTAGLYTRIAPQDRFKTPIDKELIKKGAENKAPVVGYNAVFAYPEGGLDKLIGNMARECRINFGKEIVRIDLKKKEMFFKDKSSLMFDRMVSTLPLDKVVSMADIALEEPNPYTSVLVINIGAIKGSSCPKEHWIYVPKSKTGFHRVGFYSNVDSSFLPLSSRKSGDRVSIYVEMAFLGGKKPTEERIKEICRNTVKELKEWGYIDREEAVSPTWIDSAYTWQLPDSDWKDEAIEELKKSGIYSIGRYGKWRFQGIADSIIDGLNIGGI